MTRSPDRLLLILLALMLVAASSGVAAGAYFVGSDLQTTGEFLDGLGIAIGLVMVVASGLPGAASALAIRAVRRRAPSAQRWSVVAGGLGTLTAVAFGLLVQPLLFLAVLPLMVIAAAVLDQRVTA